MTLLFYGDNAPSGRPVPDLEELELLILQAGLVMEKRILETKLASTGMPPADWDSGAFEPIPDDSVP